MRSSCSILLVNPPSSAQRPTLRNLPFPLNPSPLRTLALAVAFLEVDFKVRVDEAGAAFQRPADDAAVGGGGGQEAVDGQTAEGGCAGFFACACCGAAVVIIATCGCWGCVSCCWWVGLGGVLRTGSWSRGL